MPRKPRRNAWKIVDGKWTRSLGSRGARVRLFERTKGGVYYRDVHVPGRGKDRKSLGTTDRGEAERLGNQLLGALLSEEQVIESGVVTLGHLWERYSQEAARFLDNDGRTRREESAHVAVLLGFFGDECDVRHLTEADVDAFVAARARGGISYRVNRADGTTATAVTQPVRARSPEVEVRLLKSMLRWGTTVRVRRGQRLLASNPLDGLRGVREQNPKRPITTWERFEKTRAAIQELAENTEDPAKHQDWLRLELALVLAEATGRRIGSIRQLRWEDFDFAVGTIRWRAEADKKRRESVVPVPASLLDEVRRFRPKLGGAFGGLLFPSRSDVEQPVRREVFQKALMRAEAHAKLPKLDGGLWHCWRRKFASERKHFPLPDVAAAGGWKDTQTLLTCYQAADADTMLAVMSETRKVTDRAVGT